MILIIINILNNSSIYCIVLCAVSHNGHWLSPLIMTDESPICAKMQKGHFQFHPGWPPALCLASSADRPVRLITACATYHGFRESRSHFKKSKNTVVLLIIILIIIIIYIFIYICTYIIFIISYMTWNFGPCFVSLHVYLYWWTD